MGDEGQLGLSQCLHPKAEEGMYMMRPVGGLALGSLQVYVCKSEWVCISCTNYPAFYLRQGPGDTSNPSRTREWPGQSSG